MLLRQLHPHPQDTRIRFVADTHTYFIDGAASLGASCLSGFPPCQIGALSVSVV